MKISLQKGPTVHAALIPVPNPLRNSIDIVGFSGMSELDYVSMNVLCAFLSVPGIDWDIDTVVDMSIQTAMKLLVKTNAINNQAQQGTMGDNGQ